MDSKTHEEVKEKLEQLKRGIPYLEDAVKKGNKKSIDYSIGRLAYTLYAIYKNALDKGTHESINDITGKIWWHKIEKDKEKGESRKFLTIKQLYSEWAKEYDTDPNLLIRIESDNFEDFVKNVKGKSILDLGCGTGRYCVELAKKGAEVTAVDMTENMMKIAIKKAKQKKAKIDFQIADIMKYNPAKKFDLIISMLVFDHIENLEKAVNVIDKASKSGTEVVISNVHPELLRKDADKKTKKTQGYLREERKTNQFYHPLEEYVSVFLAKGFVLTKLKELVFTEEYQKIKKYKGSLGLKNKPVGIIMRFEKIGLSS